jgi:excisionase family DNA binding protein
MQVQGTAGAPAASVQLYRVCEAMQILRLSRSAIYRQFKAGRLRFVNQGRTRLVSAVAIAAYVALLEREALQAKNGVGGEVVPIERKVRAEVTGQEAASR